MRILDEESNKAIHTITLLLNSNEAKELRDGLNDLISNEQKTDYHVHVDDNDYRHEITLAIYGQELTGSFNDRIQKLISSDE